MGSSVYAGLSLTMNLSPLSNALLCESIAIPFHSADRDYAGGAVT
jgi:hypothetical protein